MFDKLKQKLQDAKEIMLAPAEYDELDTSGYTPSQQMAGQGLGKILNSYQALQPQHEKIVVRSPLSGQEMEMPQIDPTAIMGTVNRVPGELLQAIQEAKVASKVKMMPSREDILRKMIKDNGSRLSKEQLENMYGKVTVIPNEAEKLGRVIDKDVVSPAPDFMSDDKFRLLKELNAKNRRLKAND
jgi:hypothetical protein